MGCHNFPTPDHSAVDLRLRQDAVDATIKNLNGFIVNMLIPRLREMHKTKLASAEATLHMAKNEIGRKSWEAFGWMPGVLSVTDKTSQHMDTFLSERRTLMTYDRVNYEFQVNSPEMMLKEIRIELDLVRVPEIVGQLSKVVQTFVIYDPDSDNFQDGSLISAIDGLIHIHRSSPKPDAGPTKRILAEISEAVNKEANYGRMMSETEKALKADGIPTLIRQFGISRSDAEEKVADFLSQSFQSGNYSPTIEDLLRHACKVRYSQA